MVKKDFRLHPNQIKLVAMEHGKCFATDMITIDGNKVGFMYRQKPDDNADSGWRFTSGCEPQEYMDNPENLSIYDVHTIANYDSDIVPFLDAPVGCAFERNSETGLFVKVDCGFPEDS